VDADNPLLNDEAQGDGERQSDHGNIRRHPDIHSTVAAVTVSCYRFCFHSKVWMNQIVNYGGNGWPSLQEVF